MRNRPMRKILWLAVYVLAWSQMAVGDELTDIKNAGQLRHLGICYANFVTGSEDGLDMELMQLYATHLGVRYQYIREDWKTIFPSLTGVEYTKNDPALPILRKGVKTGDIAANGITILPWREKLVTFSMPTFPTQVWLLAKADSEVLPIVPSGNLEKDINAVKKIMKDHKVLCKLGTCLDPNLYQLDRTGAQIKLFSGGLNELAPAVILDEAEMTILDVPDALVALDKWPGKLKIIGPISPQQEMAVAFPKGATTLRDSFNQFFAQCCKDGTYAKLVQKYYPAVFRYYPEFFKALGFDSEKAVKSKP